MTSTLQIAGGAALLLAIVTALTFATPAIETRAGTVAADGDLTLTFSGVRDSGGAIIFAVYTDPTAFATYGDEALVSASLPAREGASVTFHGLPDMPYAVRAFHDENGDGELALEYDYPLEGYGTSRAGRFEDPDFAAAATTDRSLTVRMYYLN